MRLCKEYHSHCKTSTAPVSVIYLVQTKPSCLSEISWMYEFIEVRVSMISCSSKDILIQFCIQESEECDDIKTYYKTHCKDSLNLVASLVYRLPGMISRQQCCCIIILSPYTGDGKTHYILKKMREENLDKHLVVAVDESFSVEKVISELRELYQCYDKKVKSVGIFFNFSLFNYEVMKNTCSGWSCE